MFATGGERRHAAREEIVGATKAGDVVCRSRG